MYSFVLGLLADFEVAVRAEGPDRATGKRAIAHRARGLGHKSPLEEPADTTRVTYYVNTNRNVSRQPPMTPTYPYLRYFSLESMSKSLRRYCNIVAYLRGRMDLMRPPRATLNPRSYNF